MSRNGSGTYNLPAGNPVVTGTTISSTWANSTLSDIASALTGSIASDGQTTPSANLPMGGYAHTNVGNATVRAMYATAGQVQDNTAAYLTSVSGTDVITATGAFGLSAYATGQVFSFVASGTNTGATTLNINSLGAKSVKHTDGSDLVSGDIASGAAVQVFYDGTNFQLLNDANGQSETVSNLTVTGTLTANNDALIHGLTVGEGAGSVSTNTAFGASALGANTTGVNNVAVGYQSLYNNTIGARNVAVGTSALTTNIVGVQNTAVGNAALAFSTASDNTAFGYHALYANTSGTSNDAFGSYALTNNTTGFGNVGIGYQALYTNTTGVTNTAVGYAALYSNTTGADNTAVGYNAGSSQTTGTYNAIFGRYAGAAVTTGAANTIIGANSGFSGTNNLTTGIYNVLIGFNGRTSSAGAQNQIVIGANGIGQGDNYVTIGAGSTNYIYNQFNTNATWTKASDERIKANIQDLPIGLDFINELKVKSYNWKPNNEYPTDIIGYSEENTQDLNATMYGMIAQDVKAAMDKLGYEHFGGWNVREADGLQGLSNEMFVLPLINAVKELSAQNAALVARIEALESK